jgi:hypothetical protein
MKIEHENSYVEFEFKDLHETDVACGVEVFCEGFAGRIETVWFSEDDIKSFFRQIEELDKIRKGSAELFNMSSQSNSSPFAFKIFSTNNTGHLAINISVQKLSFHLGNSVKSLKTSILFEIDPSLLPSIIKDFKKLFMMP